jgi:predicted RND superfamily exporter protein
MLGTMEVLGWQFNFVNVVAFPLVIGAGVDFGVHLVHRFRQEGTAPAALRTTGIPVLLSAVTTIVGMGGLALAQHRGAQSLGIMLVLGIGFCVCSASAVLPAAMVLWTRARDSLPPPRPKKRQGEGM